MTDKIFDDKNFDKSFVMMTQSSLGENFNIYKTINYWGVTGK